MVLPFGLALDHGVVLQVDDGAPGPVLRFRTCLPAGCVVPLSSDAKLVAAARKGTENLFGRVECSTGQRPRV